MMELIFGFIVTKVAYSNFVDLHALKQTEKLPHYRHTFTQQPHNHRQNVTSLPAKSHPPILTKLKLYLEALNCSPASIAERPRFVQYIFRSKLSPAGLKEK